MRSTRDRTRVEILCACIGVLAVLSGCGRSITGTFVGYDDLPRKDGLSAAVAKVSLSLSSEGTFELVRFTVPQTGRYSIEGDTVVLQIEKAVDRPVPNEVVRVRIVSERRLEFTDSMAAKGSILLEKAATSL